MREEYFQKRGLFELSLILGKDNLNLIEIVSYAGESMEIFYNSMMFSNIIYVDTWCEINSDKELNSYHNMDKIEHEFDIRAQNKNNVYKFKGNLTEFIKSELYKNLKEK